MKAPPSATSDIMAEPLQIIKGNGGVFNATMLTSPSHNCVFPPALKTCGLLRACEEGIRHFYSQTRLPIRRGAAPSWGYKRNVLLTCAAGSAVYLKEGGKNLGE